MPFPRAYEPMTKITDTSADSPEPETIIPLLMQALIPSVSRVYLQQVALERRLAVLQSVEGLRLHAAEHSGAFPAALDEIDVPIPEDPVTGAPFVSRREGARISIFCPAPAGEQKRRFERTYEITLRND